MLNYWKKNRDMELLTQTSFTPNVKTYTMTEKAVVFSGTKMLDWNNNN